MSTQIPSDKALLALWNAGLAEKHRDDARWAFCEWFLTTHLARHDVPLTTYMKYVASLQSLIQTLFFDGWFAFWRRALTFSDEPHVNFLIGQTCVALWQQLEDEGAGFSDFSKKTSPDQKAQTELERIQLLSAGWNKETQQRAGLQIGNLLSHLLRTARQWDRERDTFWGEKQAIPNPASDDEPPPGKKRLRKV
jgi:hypothetical protein